ncbi:hypothetical protein AB4225_29465 [Streptomyces sp. 2RAF24]|uniref:hypothetical protein n=1 Tax=Streptomyces sp. 2RAF24 TaxID=3232997 RepID=UPI003F9B9A9A
MNRVAVGALFGAFTLGVLGTGTATAATPANENVIRDTGFFKPGPDTIVKMNVGEVSTPTPAPAGTRGVTSVRNIKNLGQSCGTNVIQQTSGQGKTTLVLSVDKSVAATTKREVGVDLKYVSLGMGWDVTATYSVSNQTRFEVPAGRFGTVQAYPLYNMYQGTVYDTLQVPKGYVFAYKPIGVCFNQFLN